METAGPGDVGRIAVFLSGFEGESRPLDFWHRRLQLWWELNPAWEEGLSGGWMLVHDEQVVGFWGNLPFRLKAPDGQILRANAASTWRVSPDHRSHAMRLFSASRSYATSEPLFHCTSNALITEMLTARRTPKVPPAWTGTRVYYSGLAEKVTEGLSNPYLRHLTSRAGLLLRRIHRGAMPGLPTGCEVRELLAPCKAVDELWERTKNRPVLTRVRGSKELAWSLSDLGSDRKFALGYFERDRLEGYGLFRMRKDEKGAYVEGLDFWESPEREQSTLPALTAHALAEARQNGWRKVIVPDYGGKLAAVRHPDYLSVSDPGLPDRFVHWPSALGEFPTADRTYFTLAEGDAGF